MTTGVPDEGGAVNATRRSFIRQTLGEVGYLTAAVAVVSAAAVFSVYTYRTAAAHEAEAEAAKRITAAAEECPAASHETRGSRGLPEDDDSVPYPLTARIGSGQ